MKSIALAVLLCFSGFVSADEIIVNYASFYSHLKKIDDEDFPALQFSFGFKRVQTDDLCVINHAEIITQKKTIAIQPNPEHRFQLPTEKALKQANAKVKIDLLEAANQCDMSVQLETKADYLRQQYTASQLQELFTQYAAFFDDMGSFLSFLMPDVVALNLHFANPITQTFNNKGIIADGKHLTVAPEAWSNPELTLLLHQAPTRITAVTQ